MQAQPQRPVIVLAGEGDEIDVDLDMEPADVAPVKPAEAQKKAKVCCVRCVRTQVCSPTSFAMGRAEWRLVCQAPAKRGRKKKGDDDVAEEGAQPEIGAAGRVKLNSSIAGEP